MLATDGTIAHLYEVESRRLHAFVRRLVGYHTAQDVTHDAFASLLTDTEVRNPTAYLRQAARNAALNHLRHLRKGVELSVDDAVRDAIPDQRAGPEQVLLHRQELGRLLRAIAALPPRRREIFLMSRFEDCTYEQIAQSLGISRNTVMVQIVNALADLQEAVV